ncbi:MAG: Ig-like domain-containing protein, partial [Bifidobacteriaceae bacterium]|nr:Ig-like domain-containing protein [Bifidobacteriaceae bacterium]
ETAANLRIDGEVRLEFDPDAEVPGMSWLIEPAGSAEANGVDPVTVKAHVQDGKKNNVKDGTKVTFHIPANTASGSYVPGVNGIDVPATTVDGYASIDITSLVANGTAQNPILYYSVTAYLGADSLTGAIKTVKTESTDSPTGAALRTDGVARVVFGAGKGTAAESWLVQPDDAVAVADGSDAESLLVKVHAKDAKGNDAGSGTIVFHIPSGVSVGDQAGPADIEVPVSAGWAQIAVKSKKADGSPYSVTASVKGDGQIMTVKNQAETSELAGRSDVRLTFEPGPIDRDKTAQSLWVDPWAARADGVTPVAAHMTIQDKDGNAIAGATGCSFELIYDGQTGPLFGNAVSGGKTTTVTAPTGPDGRCNVQIYSYQQGSTPVKGIFTLDNVALESPGPDSARPTANFTNSPPSAGESQFAVQRTSDNRSPDLAIADGVDSYTVTVTVRNSQGTLLNNQIVDIYYTLQGQGATPEQVQARSGADGNTTGVATARITTEVAGTYRVEAKFGNDSIATAPGGGVFYVDVEFVEDQADPTTTTVQYSSGTALPNGIGSHWADVTLRDPKGNLVRDTTVYFTLDTPTQGYFALENGTSLGQGVQQVKTSDTGSAKIWIRKAGPENGDVLLNIWIGSANGTRIDQAHTFVFEAGGPSPADSTLVITADPLTPTPKVADGVQFYNAVVTVRDQDGIVLADKPVSFVFDKTGVTVSPAGPYTTNSLGQVSVRFTSEKAAIYTVNADVGGGYAQEENQKIEFTFGPGVTERSSLTTTPDQRIANGVSEHKATVVVLDQKGNAVAGQDVYLTVEAGNTEITGPTLSATGGKTNANGVVEVVITSEEPGTFAVRAYLGTSQDAAREVKIGSPANVQFSAGEVDPLKSSRTITPDTDSSSQVSVVSNGTDAYRVQVKVVSIDDIPVDRANVRLVPLDQAVGKVTVTPQNSDNQLTGTSTSGYYGTYYWDLKSTAEGTYYASVEVWADTGQKDADNEAIYDYVRVGQPVTLRYAGGPVTEANSWLIQPEGSAVADGESLLEVKAHAKDKDNNDANSGSVAFAVPVGLTAVVGQVETPGGSGVTVVVPVSAGYAAVSYKTDTANPVGTPYVVTAVVVGGSAITAVKNFTETQLDGSQDGRVELDFAPDGASAEDSVLSIPTTQAGGNPVGTRVADGSDSHTARVEVFDDLGNPVRDGTTSVVFSYSYTDLRGQPHSGSWPAKPVIGGVAEQLFTSLVATEWTISASIANAEVQESPQEALFVHGDPDPDVTLESFEVDSGNKLANGLDPAYARVKVQDKNGNPVAGETVTLRLLWTEYPDGNGGPLFTNALQQQGGTKFVSPVSGPDGWASANIYSVWERLGVDVRAEYDQKISANKRVNFLNDAADPGTSRFRVAPLGSYVDNVAVADGEEGYRVYVTLKNSDGVPINGVSAAVTATPIGIAGAVKVERNVTSGVGDYGQGVGAFDLTTTYAGQWKVTVAIGGDAVPREDDPALTPEWLVVFKQGDPDPGSSRLVPPGQSARADGNETQVVKAEVADAHGNAVPGAPVKFKVPSDVKVKAANGTLTDGPVDWVVATSDGSGGGVKGAATLTLVSVKTGVFYVSADVDAGPITEGAPAAVEFTNADLSLSGSELAVTTMPSTTTVAGDDFHTPRVILRDSSGNVFTPVRTVAFAYRLQGTTDWVPGATVSTVAGVATTSFTRTTAGVYEVSATVTSGLTQGRVPNDQTVALATFVAGSADAGESVFEVSQGSVLADNSTPHTAKVTVLDKNENPVAGESVTFELTGGAEAHFSTAGCGLRSCTVTSTDIGVATVSIVSPKELDVTVSGYLSGGRRVGSGVVKFENDPPVAEKSTWSITPDGPIVADGEKEYRVEVLVRDGNDLPKANAAIGLEWSPSGLAPDRAGPYLSDSSGTVVVFLTSTKAGLYTVNAMIGTNKIPEPDKEIAFVSDDIDFAHTFLTAPQTSATANGQAEQIVKATMLDPNDNPVKDAVVSFDVPADTQLAPGYSAVMPVNEDGVAELHLVSTVAGPYQVTAKAKRASDPAYTDITVGSPAQVNFVHGPVSLEHSVISGSPTGPLPASGLNTDAYTVQVALRDQNDNPVLVSGTPVSIVFQLYTPDGLTPVDGQAVTRNVVTNASGVAQTDFFTAKAGVWKATGGPTSGAAQLGSPVVLEFLPTSPQAGSSVFDVTQNPVLANGTLKHEAWVIVKDLNGNPVPGQSVAFEVEEGSAVPGPALTPAGGVVESCDFYADDPATRPAWCLTAADHGKALVEIRSEEPGSFEVTAKIGGLTVDGAPKEVSFTSGPPDPSKSSYTVSPDASVEANWPPALGNPLNKYTVTVTVKSAADILVPYAHVRLSGLDSAVRIVQQSDSGYYTGDPASGSYGSFSWDLYTSKAGLYQGAVQVDVGNGQWQTVAPATFSVRYKAGPPSVQDSWLVQPGASATANGAAELVVQAKVFDAAGNAATTG